MGIERTLRQWLGAVFAALLLLVAWPAQAAVTMTFWSQEFGRNFPHAFFTLDGVPDAGGAGVHLRYGFTAKAITPALLMGTVPGRIDVPEPGYIRNSNAHFSVVLTDAQYASVLKLVEEWGEQGDHRYSLNRRNCVHFIAEAARRAGLDVKEERRLMKKPRSFTQSVAEANAGRATVIELPAAKFFEANPWAVDGASAPAPDAVPAPSPAVPAQTVPAG